MQNFNGSKILLLALVFIFIECSNDSSPEILTGEGIFMTPSGTALIEGELILPEGAGPFPVMIIVEGSGNEPRISGDDPNIEILTNNNYGAYVYDKRGIGGSTGSYPIETPSTATAFLAARAQDVLGILDLLKTHDQIDASKMGVLGSSQGAWVNSIVYDMSKDLSYIIMVSGGVASTGVEGLYCSLTDDPNVTIDEATGQLSNFSGTIGFDPIDIINKMTLPVLWMYGNEDRSHPSRYDVNVLTELNKPNFTIQLFPNADHDLIDITTQNPVGFVPILSTWLEENN